ncbi:MAG: hypothetical protein M3Z18_04625 [Gemmatimonadota bacterium]|nr:hypothetical protein [Gemmatimonadota bacterium]
MSSRAVRHRLTDVWEGMFIAMGIGCVVWGQWYYPRTVRRIRTRMAELDRPTEKMDALLQSRLYRRLTRTMTGVGIFVIIAGIAFLITE